MSDLVGNPEDRFSGDEAHIGIVKYLNIQTPNNFADNTQKHKLAKLKDSTKK